MQSIARLNLVRGLTNRETSRSGGRVSYHLVERNIEVRHSSGKKHDSSSSQSTHSYGDIPEEEQVLLYCREWNLKQKIRALDLSRTSTQTTNSRYSLRQLGVFFDRMSLFGRESSEIESWRLCIDMLKQISLNTLK